jgi:hypothetical protein
MLADCRIEDIPANELMTSKAKAKAHRGLHGFRQFGNHHRLRLAAAGRGAPHRGGLGGERGGTHRAVFRSFSIAVDAAEGPAYRRGFNLRP